MREIRSYGSVGEPVGNHRLYPEGSDRYSDTRDHFAEFEGDPERVVTPK